MNRNTLMLLIIFFLFVLFLCSLFLRRKSTPKPSPKPIEPDFSRNYVLNENLPSSKVVRTQPRLNVTNYDKENNKVTMNIYGNDIDFNLQDIKNQPEDRKKFLSESILDFEKYDKIALAKSSDNESILILVSKDKNEIFTVQSAMDSEGKLVYSSGYFFPRDKQGENKVKNFAGVFEKTLKVGKMSYLIPQKITINMESFVKFDKSSKNQVDFSIRFENENDVYPALIINYMFDFNFQNPYNWIVSIPSSTSNVVFGFSGNLNKIRIVNPSNKEQFIEYERVSFLPPPPPSPSPEPEPSPTPEPEPTPPSPEPEPTPPSPTPEPEPTPPSPEPEPTPPSPTPEPEPTPPSPTPEPEPTPLKVFNLDNNTPVSGRPPLQISIFEISANRALMRLGSGFLEFNLQDIANEDEDYLNGAVIGSYNKIATNADIFILLSVKISQRGNLISNKLFYNRETTMESGYYTVEGYETELANLTGVFRKVSEDNYPITALIVDMKNQTVRPGSKFEYKMEDENGEIIKRDEIDLIFNGNITGYMFSPINRIWQVPTLFSNPQIYTWTATIDMFKEGGVRGLFAISGDLKRIVLLQIIENGDINKVAEYLKE